MQRPATALLARTAFAGAALAGSALLLARAVRRRPPIRFRDRVAVVTGGSRGLGLLMARELVKAGARVALLARDADELDLARRELAALGGQRVLALPCDVRDEDEVRWAIDAVAERFGRLDILINNAGIIQVGPLEHMTVDDFNEAMRTHFWGPLHATLAALPHLRQQETGRIVNIASIGGRISVPHLLPYSASKFALVGLSDGLRSELAREKIYVTTVTPGLMRTGSHVNAQFKGKRDEELAWFAISDSLPLASMAGRRAAKRILEACRYGEPSLTLTPQAKAAAIANVAAPNLTARLMELAVRLLPGAAAEDGEENRPGWQSSSRWVPSVLTRLSDRAAVENNELLGAAAAYGQEGEGREGSRSS
ncbi:MAG TPA: SDR family oxidoreductase [Thermoanaerobaculia bacterium]|jgi:NAD(P)-dependent dehydrogenase (short-subunit alcohol dehydrogenase family)|nr:SDR family oxidoreductase [Thermoanaerobaculia bacterium]